MKKVIELLEEAKNELLRIDAWYMNSADGSSLKNGRGLVKKAIELLKAAPRWETPEQYKERTGGDWPDEAAVYIYGRRYWLDWSVCRYVTAKFKKVSLCVCATEAGIPPADWKPEENSK
jgi:hypothetical protein